MRECEVRGQPKVSSSVALYLTRSGQGVSLHFTLTDWLNWASETQGSASLNSLRPTSVYCTPRFSHECWGLEFRAFRLYSKILSWAISLVPKEAYLLHTVLWKDRYQDRYQGDIYIYSLAGRGLFPPLLLVSKLRSLEKQTTFSIQVQEPHPHPVWVCSMLSSSRFSFAGLDIYVQNFLILYKPSLSLFYCLPQEPCLSYLSIPGDSQGYDAHLGTMTECHHYIYREEDG